MTDMLDFETSLIGLENLSLDRFQKCELLLGELQRHEKIYSVLLGGSVSYKLDITKSDVDLFCLVNDNFDGDLEIHKLFKKLPLSDSIVHQGEFPWTGTLYTLFYHDSMDFSIDLCLIKRGKASAFFWEPNGQIIFDKNFQLSKVIELQLQNGKNCLHPFLKSNPFSMAVITLKKIDKNLYRKHIWNAIEQLNILRRYVMQIIRISALNDQKFLGRVDRDIEDILPININEKLINCVPSYQTKSIAQKSILLADWLIALLNYMPEVENGTSKVWVKSQILYEKDKLYKLYIDA